MRRPDTVEDPEATAATLDVLKRPARNADAETMRAVISHVFSVAVAPGTRLGRPLTDEADLGRFHLHFLHAESDIWSMRLECSPRTTVGRGHEVEPLMLEGCSATLLTKGGHTAHVVLRHEASGDAFALALVLRVLCHERSSLRLDDLPLEEWFERTAPHLGSVALGKDVLQIIELAAEDLPLLVSEGGLPSDDAIALVYRDDHPHRRLATSVRQPRELNDGRARFAVHGRGVVVLAGHDDTPASALAYVLHEMLFATGELRAMREELRGALRTLDGDPGLDRSLDEIGRLTARVRRYRLLAALDIAPALTGLETPDLVLDDLRRSFGGALQMPELLTDANGMLTTLAEVTEAALAQAQAITTQRSDRRQQRWQFIVGVASGLVVPVALFVSFFGMGTTLDVAPESSLLDIRRYWGLWLLTVAAMGALVGASIWQYRRSFGPRPDADGPTLVSAHRGGVGEARERENTREALEAACGTACEYVEFDVQRLADGTLVLFHCDVLNVAGEAVPLGGIDLPTFREWAGHFLLYEDALRILRGRKKAHIDLKFVSPRDLAGTVWEIEATRRAIEIMGVDDIIVTTLEDESVRLTRAWARSEHPTLLIGLSLGRSTAGMGLGETARLRWREAFPGRRMRACDANLVVANKRLARLTLGRYARRNRLPLLVWTVDEAKDLRYWLQPNRAWLVTTNRPADALEIRRSVRSS